MSEYLNEPVIDKKDNKKSSEWSSRRLAAVMIGIPVVGGALSGYFLTEWDTHRHEDQLRQQTAVERVVAQDGFSADIQEVDDDMAYGSIAVGKCVLPGVSMRVVRRSGGVVDATSYSFTYIIDPVESSRLHGPDVLRGDEKTETFANAEAFRADVLHGEPCKPLADELAYQQQF